MDEDCSNNNNLLNPIRKSSEESFIKIHEKLSTANSESLTMSTKKLSYEVKKHEIQTLTVKLTNNSKSAIYFHWIKEVKKSSIPISLIKKQNHIFMSYKMNGVILPNSSVDIPITIKSQKAGIFTEVWTLKISPANISNDFFQLHLQAVVIDKEDYMSNRMELQKLIHKKELQSFVKILIGEVVDEATKERLKVVVPESEEKIAWRKKNKKYSSVMFSKELYQYLLDIWKTVQKDLNDSQLWDTSIETLFEYISKVKDKKKVSSYTLEVNKLLLKNENSTRRQWSTELFSICYDLLLQFIDRVVERSDSIRISYGLPIDVLIIINNRENVN